MTPKSPPISEVMFSADRKEEANYKLVEPSHTFDKYFDRLIKKDLTIRDLGKRSSVMHDLRSREIRDFRGDLIIKLDEAHGLRNGGLFC